ncbi:sigma-70 family RNA polymerase sigma factor [Sediminicurvatus halobius]|uniref:sigma-70 family RNA polymerase sigma factor n=1 Tax=Sediminicurvatus halobius TaxID=2182432 RepID=UPI001304C321|nr:sigma-70 family RNA polymerase sigma factor [Spiribacter halobius]UEX77580.1 sigma-70 family RNA polymerase sigma factor [Spiribacter halobius]
MPRSCPLIDTLLLHRDALVSQVLPIVGGRAQAEDVVHELFLRLARRDSDAGVRQPLAFLHRAARNLAQDELRHERMVARHGERQSGLAPEHAPSAEHCSGERQALERVQQALAALPRDCRAAFEMHRLGGYTHREIAAALGISASMVDKHIRRALTACRDALRDE